MSGLNIQKNQDMKGHNMACKHYTYLSMEDKLREYYESEFSKDLGLPDYDNLNKEQKERMSMSLKFSAYILSEALNKFKKGIAEMAMSYIEFLAKLKILNK